MSEQEVQAAESKEVYVVVYFGSDSGGEMWVPDVTVCETKEAAYLHYYKCAPDLNDLENRARHKSGNKCQDAIVHCGGYAGGDGNCAKRPQGVAIYKRKIQI